MADPPRIGRAPAPSVREINVAPARYAQSSEEEAMRRIVRSAMAEVVSDLRDGLEARIRNAVTAEVAPILEHLATDRRDKEDYRRDRERRERLSEVRVRKAEAELEHLESETIDKRIDGKHKRHVAWLSAIAVVITALAGLLGATLNSHWQSNAPAPAATH